MKRFGLFAYRDYYPNGGFEDFIIDFDSVDDLLNIDFNNLEEFGTCQFIDNLQIVDFTGGNFIVTDIENEEDFYKMVDDIINDLNKRRK